MLCSRLKGGKHEYIDRFASPRTQRRGPGADSVPVDHPHGSRGGRRLFHHRRGSLCGRQHPARGSPRPRRLSAGRCQHRPARQASPLGRRPLHLQFPRTSSLRRFPRRLGVHARRADRGAIALSHLRQRARGQPELALRMADLALGAVCGRRRPDRLVPHLPRYPPLNAHRRRTRHIRDRRFPRPRPDTHRCRRGQQHAFGLRAPHGEPERLGIGVSGNDLRHPRLHRLRGVPAAG